MIRPHRKHPLWIAFILHRLSGLGLVLFLPFHFYLLSLAVTDKESLNQFLSFADHPIVKIAEFGLVFLLSVHMFGGIRLMMMEMKPAMGEKWTDKQKTLAASAVALSFFVSTLFFLRAI